MKTILIIDDEAPIREMLRFSLELANFSVLEADTGAEGIGQALKSNPDLILLDWMLPDQSGIDVIKILNDNNQTAVIPIIMLTALAEEDNKVRGLKVGADDYVVKPFSPMELIARIQAVLRRTYQQEGNVISFAAIKVDIAKQQVRLNNGLVKLTSLEYKLLVYFLRHPNKVLSREKLLDEIWTNTIVTDRTIDVYMRRLRNILKKHKLPNPFITVRGMGYQFSTEAL